MNHTQRRKVRATLLAYRRKTQRAPEDIAGQLGWPVAFYHEAESGKVGLSKGQTDDVRGMIKKEIASATVRDRLRKRGGVTRIPLIGGTRVVEHSMPAPWIDTHNMPRAEPVDESYQGADTGPVTLEIVGSVRKTFRITKVE